MTFADIGTSLVRLSRPLPGGFNRPQNDGLAHRHLALFVDGLRAHPAPRVELPGPSMSLDDLHRLPPPAVKPERAPS